MPRWVGRCPECQAWGSIGEVGAGAAALRRVEASIAAMPDRMATALRMFRIEDRSQREIAQTLGISVSGVEKLLQRAYRQIRDDLDKTGEDGPAPCRLVSERGMTHGH